MAETGWLSDPIGRINNLSLAPSPKNTLQPMFEALMNSIHAIEERFGSTHLSSGTIDIEMTENDEGSYTGFIITDNGIGLDTNNMISFRKSDSMKRQCRKVFADPKLAPPLDTLIQPMRRIARSRIGLPGEIDLSGSYARLQSRRALRKLS